MYVARDAKIPPPEGGWTPDVSHPLDGGKGSPRARGSTVKHRKPAPRIWGSPAHTGINPRAH